MGPGVHDKWTPRLVAHPPPWAIMPGLLAGLQALSIVLSFQDLFNVNVSISGALPAARSQLKGVS